jgi:diamine N-acetyltransferase
MVVVLKPVSSENWYECTQLKVKPEQLNIFPAPVVYWIATFSNLDDSTYSCC